MSELCNTNEHESQALEGSNSCPTPQQRIDLKIIDDIRLEMARVYRDMRSQKIPTTDGTRLVYVLSQIGKMVELHEIERRIGELEAASEFKK